MLPIAFFARDTQIVARELLGKVICVKYHDVWLKAIIIATEAYYIHDKACHAYLGYTKKREALFMTSGTIYMYYSRGGDSLNISCKGRGNAVLVKAAFPFLVGRGASKMLRVMQQLNPQKHSLQVREVAKLCCGQALLCRALNLQVKTWDKKQFVRRSFYIGDFGYKPQKVIKTTRLGISKGRDEHLPYRFVWDKDDWSFRLSCATLC